jgi:aryl-alcohol dehydrogenase-like predicted oxidoreductase
MSTDAEVACPDPNCPSRLRISRTGKRRFSHADVTVVPLHPSPRMSVERTDLAPGYAISRMIRGGWQLSGGHGPVDRERAIEDMFAFVDRGVTTFDCADIYTGVEDMYGAFRRRLADRRGAQAARAFKVHTKFVPDWDMLPRMDKQYVTGIIDRSLQRLGTERLDLVQFHWWNYAVPGCDRDRPDAARAAAGRQDRARCGDELRHGA